MLVRNARVGEVDLVELGLPGDLTQRPGLHAVAVHVDDEVGQPLVLGHVRVGAGQQQPPTGAVGQARPHLLTVDHPVVTVRDRGGREPGQVGPGARLREQLTPQVLGGGQRPQPLTLHVLALCVLADRRGGHAVAHRVEPERHRSTRALQDAVGDGLQAAGHPEPAQAFGEVHPGQAGVVTGAQIVLDRRLLWIVVGDHFPRQFGDPFGISVIAHTSHDRNSTPVETRRGGQTSRFTIVIKVCLSCHTGNTSNKGGVARHTP